MSTGDRVLTVPRHPQWRLIGTIIWGILIAFVYVTVQTVTMILYVFSQKHELSESEFATLLASAGSNGTILSWAAVTSSIVGCALIAAVIKLKRGSRLAAYLCIRAAPPKTMLKWIAILAGFILLWELFATALGRPIVGEFTATTYATADPAWLWWVVLIVAAPLFEEAFFRGFLFTGLESSIAGSAGAIILTSVLWSIIHMQYDAFEIASIFCIGILFGSARVFTGSLIVPIGLHAISNLVSLVEVTTLQ